MPIPDPSGPPFEHASDTFRDPEPPLHYKHGTDARPTLLQLTIFSAVAKEIGGYVTMHPVMAGSVERITKAVLCELQRTLPAQLASAIWNNPVIRGQVFGYAKVKLCEQTIGGFIETGK